jgi:hypothetical protein
VQSITAPEYQTARHSPGDNPDERTRNRPVPGSRIGVGAAGARPVHRRAGATTVKQAKRYGRSPLIETIAHELAQSGQWADEKSFDTSDECERDVEARLRAWGFRNAGPTKDENEYLLGLLDTIIESATEAKVQVSRQTIPSGNFAGYAIADADKAIGFIRRASEKWECRRH